MAQLAEVTARGEVPAGPVVSNRRLAVTVGQHSDKGRKAVNQDFHGCYLPTGALRRLKGLAFAMADGISSSEVSQIASEIAVKTFLDDYFCTSEAWSVEHAVDRVLSATNSWLHTQTRNSPYRYDRDKGYVCTLSALVLKANTAYLFHVGDTRIYRLRDQALEQLTNDHRLWVEKDKSCLSRALGVEPVVEVDHQTQPLLPGDVYILATDGVYEHCDARFLIDTIDAAAASPEPNLDAAARRIVEEAWRQGSGDNLSVQIVRVDDLARTTANAFQREIDALPFPPVVEPRDKLDGYCILREMHASSRSHVYLARDEASGERVVLKMPSIDMRDVPGYLERFLMEEWIARRVNSNHVLKAGLQSRERNYLYTVTEYVEGQTLKQWLLDNPSPPLEAVRGIIEQIARGLYALHRMEILHQDLRPDNVLIDSTGTVKIIDFGSARVAGITEADGDGMGQSLPGTALFMAPEYFMGEVGTTQSDLYSLGVLAYHMLSGRFPYGTAVAKARTMAAQRRLTYRSILDDQRRIPVWVDETLKRCVQPNPAKRYQELSEFTHDLRRPNQAFLDKTRPPLMERHPVRFWQAVSAVLAGTVLVLLAY